MLQSSMSQLKEIQQRLKDSKENAALLTPDTEGMFRRTYYKGSGYLSGSHMNKKITQTKKGPKREKKEKPKIMTGPRIEPGTSSALGKGS